MFFDGNPAPRRFSDLAAPMQAFPLRFQGRVQHKCFIMSDIAGLAETTAQVLYAGAIGAYRPVTPHESHLPSEGLPAPKSERKSVAFRTPSTYTKAVGWSMNLIEHLQTAIELPGTSADGGDGRV